MSGCTVYTLCSVHFVLLDRFSVCTLVRQIGESYSMCTQDCVDYAVHLYRVPIQCGSNEMAQNRFIVQAYTPEAGRLRCFHPSLLSVVLTLCVHPSQRGTTGQRGG